MTLRDRITEYLARNGASTPAPVGHAIGSNPKRAQETLSRMVTSGHARKNEDGTYDLTDADALRAPESPGAERLPQAPVRRDQSIAKWSAGVEYDQGGGELRTLPELIDSPTEAADPEEAALFAQFGLDPLRWEITNLRRSTWQVYDETWREAYRASFKPRTASQSLTEVELDNFLTYYACQYPLTPDKETWMVPVGDLQLGKPDGGGSAGIVERFARGTESVRRDLEARGGVDRLILPWLGDCIEGIVSQGGRNVARLDRTLTEQVRILRRLTLHQIGTLAPLANEVLFVAIAGNHDETSRDQTTEPRDSWAIDAASAVSDALALTEDFAHVRFLFPEPEELGVTVDIGTDENPYVVHFNHGHSARNPAKIAEWWGKQAHGRQSAGAADLLVCAHFHHLRVEQTGGGKTIMQIPALDGGSDYFRRRTGEESQAGMVQVRITPGKGLGWDSLTVHS